MTEMLNSAQFGNYPPKPPRLPPPSRPPRTGHDPATMPPVRVPGQPRTP